jgi:hypothetical protein
MHLGNGILLPDPAISGPFANQHKMNEEVREQLADTYAFSHGLLVVDP